jgi:hypothetical protein
LDGRSTLTSTTQKNGETAPLLNPSPWSSPMQAASRSVPWLECVLFQIGDGF